MNNLGSFSGSFPVSDTKIADGKAGVGFYIFIVEYKRIRTVYKRLKMGIGSGVVAFGCLFQPAAFLPLPTGRGAGKPGLELFRRFFGPLAPVNVTPDRGTDAAL